MNKKTFTLLFVIIITIAGLTSFALTRKDTSSTTPPQSQGNTTDPTPSQPQPDENVGKIACLPKKGNGPHTLECALGLQTTDGKYYALKNAKLGSIATETKVAVKGEITGPPAGSTYDIAGEINVKEVRTLEE